MSASSSERPRIPVGGGDRRFGREFVRATLARHRLNTVCQEAGCPNLATCWGARTATFLLLGELCTRSCRFCGVATGDPRGIVDATEPRRVAAAAHDLGLAHVVLTSVDRDDLPDGGAGAFAAAIVAVREAIPEATVEALVPDFGGARESILAVAAAHAHVLGHNLETVRRLTPTVRDRRAGYDRSLDVLARLKAAAPGAVTKSSLILGLGETDAEVEEALVDLRRAGVDLVTLGQYLRPSQRAMPVERHVPAEAFRQLEATARSLGFAGALAGPVVRSSYRAQEMYRLACAASSS